MIVRFVKTGNRRYAVRIDLDADPGDTDLGETDTFVADPAPGYDDAVPHDLVHYVVEASLGLSHAVYGRHAQGLGSFLPQKNPASKGASLSDKDWQRKVRKRAEREQTLASKPFARAEMERAEAWALRCDIEWRRRQGQQASPGLRAPEALQSAAEVQKLAQIMTTLAGLSTHWQRLEIGQSLCFRWPSLEPRIER